MITSANPNLISGCWVQANLPWGYNGSERNLQRGNHVEASPTTLIASIHHPHWRQCMNHSRQLSSVLLAAALLAFPVVAQAEGTPAGSPTYPSPAATSVGDQGQSGEAGQQNQVGDQGQSGEAGQQNQVGDQGQSGEAGQHGHPAD
jgi:hypothetical protein